jgi:hypothetical protein
MTATTGASHSRDRAAIQRATLMAIGRPPETSSYDACKESSTDSSLATEWMEPGLHRQSPPLDNTLFAVTRSGRAKARHRLRRGAPSIAIRQPGSGMLGGQRRRLWFSDCRRSHHDAREQLARSELLHLPLSPQNRVRRSYRS